MNAAIEDVDLHPILIKMRRRWYLIVALGVLGGVVGLLFSLVRTPIYQAEAILGVNIFYGVTEPHALVVEDRALSRVAGLVLADETLERVLEDIPQDIRDERGWDGPAGFRNDIQLDRRLAEWDLVVYDSDPQVAATVAQRWAEVALETFDESAEHGWRSAILLAGSFVIDCEEDLKGSRYLRIWNCVAVPLDVEEENLSEDLQNEIKLSHGVLPNISYELLQAASPPDDPILWQRIWLILGGTLAGLVIGASLVLLPVDPLSRKGGRSQGNDELGSR